jgi:hypothetical protein
MTDNASVFGWVVLVTAPPPSFHERTFIAAVGDPYRAVTLVKALLHKKPQETVRAVTGLSRNAVLGYKLKPGQVIRDADR